jgi:hypothetical protein
VYPVQTTVGLGCSFFCTRRGIDLKSAEINTVNRHADPTKEKMSFFIRFIWWNMAPLSGKRFFGRAFLDPRR